MNYCSTKKEKGLYLFSLFKGVWYTGKKNKERGSVEMQMENTFWKNKKNGKVYEVLQEALDCTNRRDGEKVFIYQPIDKRDLYFVREQEEFFKKFERTEEERVNMNVIAFVDTECEGAFQIREGEKVLAELNFKKVSEHEVDTYRTFVDESLRGHGIAEKLYQELLFYAKEHKCTITPTCSYVKKRIQKNLEFLSR